MSSSFRSSASSSSAPFRPRPAARRLRAAAILTAVAALVPATAAFATTPSSALSSAPSSAAGSSGSPATSPTGPVDTLASAKVKPTIVLVHGAWADASSFAPVTARLQHDGYTVLNAPNPLRGLAADAASVSAFVNQATTGPVVLVGHSYGGAVITNAATSTPRVKALAYIDAYAPDAGESIAQLSAAKPGSVFAVADPSTVFDAVQDPNLPQGDPDLYVKRDLFAHAFAAHLPATRTRQLAASQSPVAGGALQEPSGQPAWKHLPSVFFIGSNDQVIPAAEQKAMAERAHASIVTAKADHLSMLEKPAEVTATIERAAAAR
ncbi:pimeloyl-ACP methyl ester carboxylesterase [Kineococcus radiotolerans]|uniref:Pimeloyl-ACP methyl ester carboxylesterase n=1 Tax=Kineococcus radiotolerans TaxID=131568 RepID=A0A7W4XYS5_KINRA|nr:alpha/beta hydrolase [Kineococcus radiotolerans]MBB2903363.1 pimeloyl-ACP methyl ester carboxylesterase [Kineococcus radiotolerans]